MGRPDASFVGILDIKTLFLPTNRSPFLIFLPQSPTTTAAFEPREGRQQKHYARRSTIRWRVHGKGTIRSRLQNTTSATIGSCYRVIALVNDKVAICINMSWRVFCKAMKFDADNQGTKLYCISVFVALWVGVEWNRSLDGLLPNLCLLCLTTHLQAGTCVKSIKQP